MDLFAVRCCPRGRQGRFLSRLYLIELAAPFVEASPGYSQFLRQLSNVFAGPHALHGQTLKLPGISFSRHGWFLSPEIVPISSGSIQGFSPRAQSTLKQSKAAIEVSKSSWR